jgi:predicted nucleic acid-binding protein
MRVFLDANVVLDVLLDRQPFVAESKRVWAGSDAGAFDAHIAAFTLTTIHYLCEKHDGPEAADRAVDICLEAFEIAALYRECVVAARRMSGRDFEDNLQIACALTDFTEAIVTRNPGDFRASPIAVYTPTQFLAELRLP